MNSSYLENHFLASGDIEDLTHGLVYAKEHGLICSVDQLAARQLAEQYRDNRSVVENLKEFYEAGTTNLDNEPLRFEMRNG